MVEPMVRKLVSRYTLPITERVLLGVEVAMPRRELVVSQNKLSFPDNVCVPDQNAI